MDSGKKTVSLVLGGGGARGLAHIGVIRCLEDLGFEIRNISGTSMGALIGGIYATGKLDIYADWVSTLQKTDIVRLMDWSLRGKALLKGDRIIAMLKELIGEYDIEDLPIGFTAVATSLYEEKEIWLNQGPLFSAIRASIAVPMIFTPVVLGNRLLVDGSVVNPLPIAPTLNDDTELTIAVDLCAPPEIPITELAGQKQTQHQASHYPGITRLLDSVLSKSDMKSKNLTLGAFELLTRSMDTTQACLIRFKLAAYSADILIRIPRNLCGFFEFNQARLLIDYGYQRAQETLAQAVDHPPPGMNEY
jgi:NTE family protein